MRASCNAIGWLILFLLLPVAQAARLETPPGRYTKAAPAVQPLAWAGAEKVDPEVQARWGFLAQLAGRTFTSNSPSQPVRLTVEWKEKGEVLLFASRLESGEDYDPTTRVFRYDRSKQRLEMEAKFQYAHLQPDGTILFKSMGLIPSATYLVPTGNGFYVNDGVFSWQFVDSGAPGGAAATASAGPAAAAVPVQDEVALVLEKLRTQQGPQVQAKPADAPAAPQAAPPLPAVRDDAIEAYLAGLRSRIRLIAKSCGPDDVRLGGSLAPGERPLESVNVHYSATCPGKASVVGIFLNYTGDGLSCVQSNMRPVDLPCQPDEARIVVEKVTAPDYPPSK